MGATHPTDGARGGAHRSADSAITPDLGVVGGTTGVVDRGTLIAAGLSDAAIRSAVHAERLHRLRPGWFALPEADPEVVRAVRAGGGLTCVSALSRLGVWVPEDTRRRTHIRVARNARTGAPAPGFRWCASGNGVAPVIDDVAAATRAAARCLRGPDLVAVFDSLLNRGILDPAGLLSLFPDPPRRVRRALAAADGSADSGSETRIRLYLRSRRLRHRTQVFIPCVGTVDFLVGRSLIIEADSEEHHGGDRIDDDIERDLRSAALGFATLRVSYRVVFRRFHLFVAALDRDLAGRLHRLPTEICP